MVTKRRKRTKDAVEILERRYYEGKPQRQRRVAYPANAGAARPIPGGWPCVAWAQPPASDGLPFHSPRARRPLKAARRDFPPIWRATGK